MMRPIVQSAGERRLLCPVQRDASAARGDAAGACIFTARAGGGGRRMRNGMTED